MLDELVSLIETLAERIGRHREVLGKNEMHTRMALVDPLLRALGWDTSDPQVVSAEYAVQGVGRADYALLGEDAKPVAIIEAKKLGEPVDEHVRQMLNYANAEGIPYAGLTDGNHWHLYNVVFEPGQPIQDRRILEAQLADGPAVTCAVSLVLLWRRNLSSSAPPPTQPSARAPQAPSPPASTPNDRTDWFTLADFNPATAKPWPTAVRFPDNPHLQVKRISKQKELLRAVAEGLIQAGKLTTGNGTLESGRARYIVHHTPTHQNGGSFQSPVKLGRRLFLETSNAFAQTVEYAKRLVKHCGMNTGQVELRW